jgi:Immunity protein 44
MKLWMSGEIEADVDDAYMKARNVIQAQVNRLLDRVSLEGKADEWDFIAIIRREDSPDYDEVARHSSRGKSLEFRLKIPHPEFLAAGPAERMRLIFRALFRSIVLMEKLGVSPNTQSTLQTILSRAETEIIRQDSVH